MNKTEMLKEISILQETLRDCDLTPADKVAIRNEIGDLQDRIALMPSGNNPLTLNKIMEVTTFCILVTIGFIIL
jgi:hypothetical protein